MEKSKTRVLCWDEKNIETRSNIEIRMHKPEKKNLALVCEDEWEGVHNGYGSVMKVGDTYRFYYRADASRHMMSGKLSPSPSVICVAESRDGITFEKPNIGKYDFNGTKNNNIVFARDKHIDNFSVFLDQNPNCPPDERFKALSACRIDGKETLLWYASEDGYGFTEKGALELHGTFDSFNVMLWDASTQQYFLFYRAFHKPDGHDLYDFRDIHLVNDIRDIRVATSKDFRSWTEHGQIRFEAGQDDYPLYTNQIAKYPRAQNMFVGFPVRYCDRAAQKENFAHMPLGDRHENITALFGREGTSVTDCVIMTSHDGFTFDRRDEAYLTPGVENRYNWWYGNCYTAYGFVETPAEERDAPRELSMYVGEGYRIKNVSFRRYTLRLDGFFSWFGSYRGGEVLTKTFLAEGDKMFVNFASSAVGGMEIAICNTDGTPIEGYESGVIFGDSTDRPVKFKKDLSLLRGQTVRLKFRLRDCHLYSYCFES